MRRVIASLVLCLLSLGLAFTSTTQAQDDPLAPTVAIEVEDFSSKAVPSGAPIQTVLSISVGCDAIETAGTTTTVTVQTPDELNIGDLTLSPDVHTWKANETRCTPLEDDTPVERTTIVHLRVTEGVPGFETRALPLEVTVTKQDPEEALDARTYGPYEAEAAFETGYANRFEVRAEERVVSAGLDETVTFQGVAENRGNYATRFSFSVEAPPSVLVDGLDEPFVVEPGEAREWSFDARLENPEPQAGPVSLTLVIETEADHASAAEGRSSEVGLLATFQGDEENQNVPGIAPWGVAVMGALLAWSRRAPSRV